MLSGVLSSVRCCSKRKNNQRIHEFMQELALETIFIWHFVVGSTLFKWKKNEPMSAGYFAQESTIKNMTYQRYRIIK